MNFVVWSNDTAYIMSIEQQFSAKRYQNTALDTTIDKDHYLCCINKNRRNSISKYSISHNFSKKIRARLRAKASSTWHCCPSSRHASHGQSPNQGQQGHSMAMMNSSFHHTSRYTIPIRCHAYRTVQRRSFPSPLRDESCFRYCLHTNRLYQGQLMFRHHCSAHSSYRTPSPSPLCRHTPIPLLSAAGNRSC